MGKKARTWVQEHLGSLIDPKTNLLLLEKRTDSSGTVSHVIDADVFADQFATVLESSTKGKAAAMKAVKPTVPEGKTESEKAQMLAAGLGFDKYIDAWKAARLIP